MRNKTTGEVQKQRLALALRQECFIWYVLDGRLTMSRLSACYKLTRNGLSTTSYSRVGEALHEDGTSILYSAKHAVLCCAIFRDGVVTSAGSAFREHLILGKTAKGVVPEMLMAESYLNQGFQGLHWQFDTGEVSPSINWGIMQISKTWGDTFADNDVCSNQILCNC